MAQDKTIKIHLVNVAGVHLFSFYVKSLIELNTRGNFIKQPLYLIF